MSVVVLFNKPIWARVGSEDSTRDREIIELWGFNFYKYLTYEAIDDYITYLCGASRWQQEGQEIIVSDWIDALGMVYEYLDPYILNYCEKARQQMHITYEIYVTNKRLTEDTPGMYDECFITGKELHDYIKDFGVKMDVQNSQGKRKGRKTKTKKRGTKTPIKTNRI